MIRGFGREPVTSGWQIEPSWYNPSLHNATFVIADPRAGFPVAIFERAFGRPAATHTVGRYTVLIYRTNLLRLVTRATCAQPTAVLPMQIARLCAAS